MKIIDTPSHSHCLSINHGHKCHKCHKQTFFIHDYTDTIYFTTSFNEPESESMSEYICIICDIKDRLASARYQAQAFVEKFYITFNIARTVEYPISKKIQFFKVLWKHNIG